ncbi:hypothetical protein EXIGLDRAFT_611195, partial [Exidia glandulosa HHB12029]
IRKACSQADLVFNIADCDDVPMTVAVLAGLKERFEQTGRRPVLIHTSGTGVIMDKAQGVLDPKVAAEAFDDANEEDIKRIPPENIHRNVDELIFAADAEGYIDGWIVAPPTIYGVSNGPLARDSRQIPIIIALALAAGKPICANDGSATWDNVHVQDLVDFYELLVQKALSPATRNAATRPSPYSKFFFCESGQHSWRELTEAVAEALYKRGIVPTKEVTSVSYEDAVKAHPWAFAVMTNSFGKATKARQMGWVPKHVNWRADVDEDVERALKTLGKI